MTELPEACGDQGRCPGFAACIPSCQRPLWAAALWARSKACSTPGGEGASRRFKLKLPGGPSSAELPVVRGCLHSGQAQNPGFSNLPT